MTETFGINIEVGCEVWTIKVCKSGISKNPFFSYSGKVKQDAETNKNKIKYSKPKKDKLGRREC